MNGEALTWNDAVAIATKRFKEAGLSEANLNAEYLAMNILGIWVKSEFRKHNSDLILPEQKIKLEKLISRRLNHEPLQHIIGETEFFGLRLFTSSAALIPRPDTEILVEEVLKEVKAFDGRYLHILDIGTGSGAIALALASKLSGCIMTGIDISAEAIALAEKNKARLKITNAAFEVLDIFASELENRFMRRIDILVSNPPYISANEFETLDPEVRDFDPRIALTDEADGFIFYRRIAEIAPKILKKNGKILVEVGYDNGTEVEKIFLTAGLDILRSVKDLQETPRVKVIGMNDRAK